MRVNPYNWSKQSRDHLEFAAQNYPTIAALVQDSANYPAFALGVQALPPFRQQRYLKEWNDWNERFGRTWQRMGGLRERRFGQIASRHRIIPKRGTLGALGALAPPSPPTNYHVCSSLPPGGIAVTGAIQDSSITGWRFREVTGLQGRLAGVKFYEVWEITSGKKLYWYPNYISCAGTTTSESVELKEKIKELQRALNDNGFGLVVDGVMGSRTCAAAYEYQTLALNIHSHLLTGDFFLSIGLPSGYATFLGNRCTPWYKGELPEYSGPSLAVEPEPMVAPAPEQKIAKAGMSPWTLILIGAAILGGVVYASRKKKARRK